MTEEEKKVFFEYLKSIQANLDSLLEEKKDDATEILDKYKDLMLAISKLSTEVSLLTGDLQNFLKTVKKEHHTTNELIDNKVEQIEKSVKGKTRVIVKEVDRLKKKWWQIWLTPKQLLNFKKGV